MSSPLIEIDSPEAIETGIVKSAHPLKCPLWWDGENVLFSEGCVRKSPGYLSIFDKPGSKAIRGFGVNVDSGVQQLFFGDVDKLYKYNTATVTTEGTGFTGYANSSVNNPASRWSLESWGIWMVATNFKDAPQIYKPSLGFDPIGGGAPSVAKILIRRGPFMLAFNTDLGPTYFEWCDLDDVEDWVSGAAGNLNIRDLDSEILAAVRLGPQIAAYTENQMCVVNYLGDPLYFGSNPALEGIGTVGIDAVVSRGRRNYGFSRQGIWVTDGSDYEYIDPPEIRRWLQDNVNWAEAPKINGFLNEVESLIEWAIPTGSNVEPNKTVCYNYKNDSWTFRSYGFTAGQRKLIFSYPIIGMSTGHVHFTQIGVDANGSALVAWVQTRPMFGTDKERDKYVDELKLLIHRLAGTGVDVQLGWCDELTATNNNITWETAQEVLADRNATFWRFERRYISLKVTTSAVGDDFALSGFTILGNMTGMRNNPNG